MVANPHRKNHRALGPGGSWKSGQRVPRTGSWVDQHGVVSFHYAGDTFPPCVGYGRKGECAYRRPFVNAGSRTA
jgi:hypothetical protein